MHYCCCLLPTTFAFAVPPADLIRAISISICLCLHPFHHADLSTTSRNCCCCCWYCSPRTRTLLHPPTTSSSPPKGTHGPRQPSRPWTRSTASTFPGCTLPTRVSAWPPPPYPLHHAPNRHMRPAMLTISSREPAAQACLVYRLPHQRRQAASANDQRLAFPTPTIAGHNQESSTNSCDPSLVIATKAKHRSRSPKHSYTATRSQQASSQQATQHIGSRKHR